VTGRITIALAALLSLLALPTSVVADEAEPLFDPAAVAEIDFVLPPASLQKLEEEPETDKYQHAEITVKVAGQTISLGDVGFRLKGGHGSFRDLTGKAAFKVKFDKFVDDQELLGLKKMTLNNMVQDPSMVHETMVYALFREMGVPAPRTGYAFVRINGEPYGVYLNVETYDDVMLPRLFPSTRHLYEADAAGVDVRPGEADTYEVDEGDDEDLGDLEALIAAADDTVGDWSDGMEAVADLDEMTRMWAVERYAGNWDGYAGTAAPFRPNNYYLHSDEAGVFAMLPWGTDQTWEEDREVAFDEPAGGLLFNNCFADAGCEALYEAGLEEVAAKIPALELDQVAICTADLLAPWQGQEDPLRAEYGADEIAEGVADARSFMSVRAGELADYLGAEPPSGVPDGTDPCGKPEEPEESKDPVVEQPPQVGPPVVADPLPARFGPTRLKGNFVKTAVRVPGAGTVTQRVTVRIDGKAVRACSAQADPSWPGKVTVGCRLRERVRAARADEPLKLRVRVRFIPEKDGRASSVLRLLGAPRHG
jgi:CotH kinase protein